MSFSRKPEIADQKASPQTIEEFIMRSNPRSLIVSPILLSSILALPAMAPRAQQPAANQTDKDQNVRLKTELVQLRAVVTDKKGNLVDNLQKSDFEVLENGQHQDVSFFSLERAGAGPSSAVGPAAAPAGVPKGPAPAAAAAPARTIVVFVDTLHLSNASFMRAKQQLRKFVDEQLTDQDMVAVVSTFSNLGVLQQFTRDRKFLRYAVEKLTHQISGDSLFSPYLAARILSGDPPAMTVGTQILASEEGIEPASGYVEARARETYGLEANLRKVTLLTLDGVCQRLAEMPGQRIIAYVGDGFTTLDDGGGADNQELEAAIGRAARSGIVIYSLNARGLEAPDEFKASSRLSASALNGSTSFYLAQARTDQETLLRTLAAETGGEAYVNRNDMNKSLQAMLDNNRVYYAIAFYPADLKDPRKIRKISIKVKDHPEYTVRAQKGYLPAEERKEVEIASPQERLFRAMISPLPATTIDVSASADFLEAATDDAQVTLQAHIEGTSLDYQKQEDHYELHCEVAVAIFDSTGSLSDKFAEAIVTEFTAGQLELAKRNGYRWAKRLSLKPGLYQVRLGVREITSEKIGTSTTWVEVPDLKKDKLVLSSIFLGKIPKPQAAPSSALPGASPDNQTPRVEPIAGRALFRRGEGVSYHFVVYNAPAEAQTDQGCTVKTEILQGETAVYSKSAPLSARTVRKDEKGTEAGGMLSLGLDPGMYTLQVTVTDPKSKKPVKQSVDFEMAR
jgi:VWFA-related protein